ncbi:MAG TPA: 5-carboxymethyl-2-hydroxymuconate Delta-isomerase [Woeseiaceae bacterium]|nr:5-carboxymethyl-2-hydroxymuconate Delta-isomerase [Woeseiaceae bacterium]
MPHQIVEYSANLEDAIDIDALIECLHTAALETGVFPLAGLRTRAVRRDHYRIADGHPDNAFVHVLLRIRFGRSLSDRQRAADAISGALFEFLGDLSARRPLAISLDIQDIDPHTNRKSNNLRDWLAERGGGRREA